MEWIINQLREHPELAIFLTLFAGFWIGRLKIGKFSLGTVTSVLLVGVLVGQLNITADRLSSIRERIVALLYSLRQKEKAGRIQLSSDRLP